MSSHSTTPTPPPVPTSDSGKYITWIIYVVIFFIALSWIKECKKDIQEEMNKKSSKTFVEGSNRGLYLFSENNDTIYFQTRRGQRLFTYPKGGKINIVPPSGNGYIDVPGVDVLHQPEKPGIYMITPAEQSATGVEIRVE